MPQPAQLPAAGRGARHHLRAHRRRRRHPRARQRRASRRAAAHARARPPRGPCRRAPLRVRRPAALLRARAGRRVRGDVPRRGSDGQFATANVQISVREADPETNTAPGAADGHRPGDRRRDRAHPDPARRHRPRRRLGAAARPGDQPRTRRRRGARRRLVEYEAGEYSAGTDTFQYSVVDALGARATGSDPGRHRAARSTARANPIAVEDTITVRPGRTISVRVLANDSDPDGGALTLHSVEPNGPDATATVEGDTVQVEVPDRRGRLRLHLRDRERGARHGVELPHGVTRATTRRSPTRGVRHGAHAERHPRRGRRRRRGAAQRVPRRRRRRRPRRRARRRATTAAPRCVGTAASASTSRTAAGSSRSRSATPRTRRSRRTRFIWVPGRDDALPQLRTRRARRARSRAARRSCSTSTTT